jgi:hypothetical protein
MTWKYAQIDTATGKCVAVSFLSGEVIAEHMILLDEEQDVNPRDIYNSDGTWTPAEPIPVEPDEITLLKQDNEDLNLQIIDLWETLIGAGVI